MRDARRRNERQHAVEKSDARPQYRSECKFLARDFRRLHCSERRFYVDHFQRQFPGDLIAEEHAYLVQELAKALGREILVAHQREFVLDQGMADEIYDFVSHKIAL